MTDARDIQRVAAAIEPAAEADGSPLCAVDRARRDLQEALAAAGAALERAGEAYSRLCVLANVPLVEEVDRNERRYVPGPHPPEWRHVSFLAEKLGVHENTAFRVARQAAAQWPYGPSRRIDMSKFRDTLPNLQKIAKTAT